MHDDILFLMCKGSSLRGYAIDCYSPSYCYAWTFSLRFSSMIDCRLNCDIFGLIGLRSRLTYFTFFEIAMLFQSKRWFTGIMSILRFVNRSFRNFWAMLIHRIHASLPHRARQLTSQVGTWHWRDAFLSKCSRPSWHRFRQLFLRVFLSLLGRFLHIQRDSFNAVSAVRHQPHHRDARQPCVVR